MKKFLSLSIFLFTLICLPASVVGQTGLSHEWSFNLGSTSSEKIVSVVVDNSDNIYVYGDFWGTTDFDPSTNTVNLTPVGANDIFIAKYDSNKNFIWVKQIGGTSNDYAYQMVLDGSGNIHITGAFGGTSDFDPSSNTANLSTPSSSSTPDAFFAKYDNNGNYLWSRRLGSSAMNDYDQGKSIAVDNSGNVYVSGFFSGTTDFDPSANTANLTSNGNYDVFIAKYNSSGNYLWVKGFGGTGYDYSDRIVLDGNNNVFVAGRYTGTVDFDPTTSTNNITSIGGDDIFISKFNTSGTYLWTRSIGGNGNDQCNDIITDNSNNFYITGYFNETVDFNPSSSTNNITSNGGRDIFIAKYDNSGNYLWANGFGGLGGDSGYSLYYENSFIHCSGSFYDNVDFDPSGSSYILYGYFDVFLAKYSSSNCTYSQAVKISTGYTSSSNGYDFDLNSGDDLIIGGDFSSSKDFDPSNFTSTLTSNGSTDAFLAKYSPCNYPTISSHPINRSLCVGQNTTFSVVASSADALYYQWQLSTNSGSSWSNISNSGVYSNTTTATLNISGGSSTMNNYQYRCLVYTTCGNTFSNSAVLNVFTSVPSQPSTISGNMSVCQGTTQTYSVTNVSGVSYTWSVPSGWSINSGQGTNSISVSIGSASGNVVVTPSNACGNGSSRSLATSVTTSVPSTPSIIAGNYTICQGSSQAYSVNNVSGVTYTWSVPSGWSINSGQGSNSISVTVGSSSGDIVVVPSNVCGNGPSMGSAITVTTSAPPQPSSITGSVIVCEGSTQPYSVDYVFGVTYNWSLPSGWSINFGQGSDYIVVTVGSSSGNITVTPSNSCGSGTPRSLSVSSGAPIISSHPQNDEACETQTVYFAVTGSNATSYQWQLSTNGGGSWSNISNGGDYNNATTASLSVYVSSTSMEGYQYRCVVNNSCGSTTSNAATLTILEDPVITNQPTDAEACIGSDATFTITATDAHQYEWERRNPDAEWTYLIQAASDGGVTYTDIDYSNSGIQHIVFSRGTSTGRLFYYRYLGGAFPACCGLQLTTTNTSYNSVVSDNNTNSAYIAFRDAGNGSRASVIVVEEDDTFYNLGSAGFSDGSVTYTNIAMGSTNEPYVVYADLAWGNAIVVKKYDSGLGDWVTVGTEAFSDGAVAFTKIVFDKNGVPYVAYQDLANGNRATVKKYNELSGNWEDVGSSGFTNGSASYVDIKIDFDNNPHIAFADGDQGDRASAMTFDGSTWNYSGSAGFSGGGTTTEISLEIDYQNKPHVLFIDNTKPTLMRLDYNSNNWTNVANPAFTSSAASYISLEMTASGSSTVTFRDNAAAGRLSIMYVYEWENVQSSSNNTLTVSNVEESDEGNEYRCLVIGQCDMDMSNSAFLNLIDDALELSAHPQNITICANENTTFTAAATGALSYQWQISTDYGFSWNNVTNSGVYSNATTNALTITGATTSMNNYQYRCVFNSICLTANSNAATLNVITSPVIYQQPLSTSVCVGQTVEFSIGATFASSYQWQVSTNGGSSWSDVNTGVTYNMAYTVSFLSVNVSSSTMNGYLYRCIATNSCGSATSNSATLTVLDYPTITNQPTNQEICPGNNASFTVSASNAISYTWEISYDSGFSWWSLMDDATYSGVYTSTLSISNPPDYFSFYTYRCVISNGCGNTYTNNVSVTILGNISISQHPSNQWTCEGGTATFNVVANNANQYQWQKRVADAAWNTVGNVGFTKDGFVEPSIAISNNGTAYVAFSDFYNNMKATVMWFDGSEWKDLGNPGFTGLEAIDLNMAIDNNNVVYVAFSNPEFEDKLSVMFYDNGNWSYLGEKTISDGQAQYPYLAVNNSGELYVAFKDNARDGKMSVLKYSVDKWISVGDLGFTDGYINYPNLAFDNFNQPFVAYRDGNAGDRASVMNFDGISWKPFATAITPDVADYVSMAIDNQNRIHLAYQDRANDNRATVMTYEWGWWNMLGWAPASEGMAENTTVKTDNTGVVYLSYIDYETMEVAVKKYQNWQWSAVSTQSISNGPASNLVMDVDVNGTVYVFYEDWNEGFLGTVKSYDGWENISGATSSTLTLTNVQATDNNSEYRCIVSNTCGNSIKSNSAFLYIQPNNPISENPSNAEACTNQWTGFSVQFSQWPWSMQWQVDRNDGNGFVNLIDDASHVGTSWSYLSVLATSSMNNYKYRIMVTGSCGTSYSEFASLRVYDTPPAQPTAIAGSAYMCNDTYTTYSIAPVANANYYYWSVPDNVYIVSGQGTTEIEVYIGKAQGTIYVSASNSCGSSIAQTLNVTAMCTKLQHIYCGTTVVSLDDALYAESISGALNYEWELVSQSNGAVLSLVRDRALVRLSMFSGMQYGTTYDVRVRAYFNGQWTNWGPSCEISTPAASYPTTRVRDKHCGTTLSTMTEAIYCYKVDLATNYWWEFTSQTDGTVINYNRGSDVLLIRPSAAGLSPGVTYSIRIRPYVDGAWRNYGASCLVTMPGTATRTANEENLNTISSIENDTDEDDASNMFITIFPNPTNKLTPVSVVVNGLNTIDKTITIEVTDMVGKKVYEKKADNNGGYVREYIRFDNDIASGSYFINIKTSTEVIVRKIVVL